jgi:hypothetical protein
MMDSLRIDHGTGMAIILIAAFVFAVGIAWILLPFAIFGTKPILRELLEAAREHRELTRQLLDRMGPPTRPDPPPSQRPR